MPFDPAQSNSARENSAPDASRLVSGNHLPARSGTIQVRIRELNQLFNSMDPSPFHEKGLDADAEEYIVGSARQLPSQAPAALLVHLDRPIGIMEEERVLGDAIRVHFARRAQLLRWELRRLLRRGSISLVIGLAALAIAIIVGESIATRAGGHLGRVIGESLHLLGYVAMWHPLEIFLYEWWPILGERRVHDRLSRMPVRIVYAQTPPSDAAPDTVSEHPSSNHAWCKPFGPSATLAAPTNNDPLVSRRTQLRFSNVPSGLCGPKPDLRSLTLEGVAS